MRQLGDTVMLQGIKYKITGATYKRFNTKTIDFWILRPIDKDGSVNHKQKIRLEKMTITESKALYDDEDDYK